MERRGTRRTVRVRRQEYRATPGRQQPGILCSYERIREDIEQASSSSSAVGANLCSHGALVGVILTRTTANMTHFGIGYHIRVLHILHATRWCV
jgi:hypothetical protein